MEGHIQVGTSGFVYPHWKRIFYPPGIPASGWLEHYARVFSTVEINATFYRLPERSTVRRWRDMTPPSFLFACKGSRFLTHMKRLTNVEEGLRRFLNLVQELGPKLSVLLWQLPPQMKADPLRLARFLEQLPSDVRHVLEFRNVEWHSEEVMRLLDANNVAVCEHDLLPPPPRVTGGFRYVRFHGTSAKYRGRYGKRRLRPWARSLQQSARRGEDAFVFFNNDLEGHALLDAMDLSGLLRGSERLLDAKRRHATI